MTKGPRTAYSIVLIQGFKLSMVTVCCQVVAILEVVLKNFSVFLVKIGAFAAVDVFAAETELLNTDEKRPILSAAHDFRGADIVSELFYLNVHKNN